MPELIKEVIQMTHGRNCECSICKNKAKVGTLDPGKYRAIDPSKTPNSAYKKIAPSKGLT